MKKFLFLAVTTVFLFTMCGTPQPFATNPKTATDSYAFVGNYGQNEYVIPDNTPYIAEGAFAKCFKLQSITIPTSVTSIAKWAFFNCFNLKTIHYKGTMEQWESVTKIKTWNSGLKNCVVKCTDGVIEL